MPGKFFEFIAAIDQQITGRLARVRATFASYPAPFNEWLTALDQRLTVSIGLKFGLD